MPSGLTFEEWMSNVDQEISNRCGGLTSRDLPDQTYWDWWDSGEDTLDAAYMALEDAGFSFDEDEEYEG